MIEKLIEKVKAINSILDLDVEWFPDRLNGIWNDAHSIKIDLECRNYGAAESSVNRLLRTIEQDRDRFAHTLKRLKSVGSELPGEDAPKSN